MLLPLRTWQFLRAGSAPALDKDLIGFDLRRGRRGSTIRRMGITNRVMSIARLSGLPRPLQVGIYSLAGVTVGLALMLVRIANATSYLSDEPQACINCHVMTDAYASWQRGSHGHVAVCNDCHVPHDNIAAKYAFKGRDGLKHSYVFTKGSTPQVLGLSAGAIPAVQANCVRCHEHQVMMVRVAGSGERRCWDCHQGVHGKTRSLSASPVSLRPGLPDAGLDWMKKGAER